MFFIISIIFTALTAFFDLYFSITLLALFFIFKKILFCNVFLTCGLPTLAGTATFSLINGSDSVLKKYLSFSLQFLLPLLCMILFIIHPVAGSAFLYSFYWFIPVTLYFTRSKNVFVLALSSTFVTHAVGSILYLYATSMSSDKWLDLIPVVAFERLAAAFGIAFFYAVVKGVVDLYAKSFVHKTS